MYYTYEWFAINDFIDEDGNLHYKDSAVYIGSGSKDRYKSCENYKIRSSRASRFYLAYLDKQIDSRLLKQNLSKENSILEEQLLYDDYISRGYGNSSKKKANKIQGNKGFLLFNAQRPIGLKNYDINYLSKYLELDSESPSGLRWKDSSEPYYRNLSKTSAGTLNNSGYWVVNIKAELWHCHKIVKLFKI